jgi:hypothetical protein
LKGQFGVSKLLPKLIPWNVELLLYEANIFYPAHFMLLLDLSCLFTILMGDQDFWLAAITCHVLSIGCIGKFLAIHHPSLINTG